MSCIVGYCTSEGNVLVGADTRISTGTHREGASWSKLIRREGLVIGCVGACRLQQILEHHFLFPWVNEREMIAELPSALMELFGAYNFGDHKSERAANFGDQLLLATDWGLFTIHADYCILKHEKYTAIGSGRDYALGAFHSMENYTRATTETKCERALWAAINFDLNCGGPLEFALV